MNKDVIYIDVEDDITAIISKVKASSEKIVALVPPKRIGVLQSAVNLRLMKRAAEQADKRLVLITNNHALSSLAAAAQMPVAKNLQSKPELLTMAAVAADDEDDIIDGNTLPVGEHAGLGTANTDDSKSAALLGSKDLAQPPKAGEPASKAKAKSAKGIPDFNRFRKKLLFGGAALVLLIGFIVWATFIAPSATVIVSAKTSNSSVNEALTVGETLATDATKKSIKAVAVKKTEQKSIDFTATGSKNIGEKAAGAVQFSTNTISALGTTIPAGTRLSTSGGLVFVTNQTVVITIDNYQNAPTTITAAEQGAQYNAATGSVSGAPNGISGTINEPTSGGTDKIAKVVTAADIQKAKQALVDGSTDSIKSDLQGQFKGDVKPLSESYKVDFANVVSSPGQNEEASDSKATLTATANFVMLGVSANEAGKLINVVLEKSKADDQRVYENGSKDLKFQDVAKVANGVTTTLIATAKIGPNLNETEIKNLAKGERFGDIQESIQAIQGVEDVDVTFFPFWISTVPNDTNKINVQFKVNGQN